LKNLIYDEFFNHVFSKAFILAEKNTQNITLPCLDKFKLSNFLVVVSTLKTIFIGNIFVSPK